MKFYPIKKKIVFRVKQLSIHSSAFVLFCDASISFCLNSSTLSLRSLQGALNAKTFGLILATGQLPRNFYFTKNIIYTFCYKNIGSCSQFELFERRREII